MLTISKNIIGKNIINKREPVSITKNKVSIWERYMSYAENQEKWKIYWYMKVIIAVPCIFMVISIMIMASLTASYIWFVGLSMVLFFANVIAHIAEVKSTFYVPLYHVTVAILTLIPFITFLILA